jgi:hypothetical protein
LATAVNVISPGRLTRLLSGVVLLLISANLVGQYSKYYWDRGRLCGFVWLFYGELHGNIPHWFKAMCMLVIAVILFCIYKIQIGERARFQRHWLSLSVIFLLMSIVQSTDIHNALSPCIRSALGVGGALHFAWVIPAIVIVLALGLVYIPFFVHLPPKTRVLFVLAGLMYVVGAIAFEMATAYYMTRHGIENFGYAALSAVHEALKMAGLVVFIHAIMSYWRSKHQPISLLFGDTNAQP